MSERLAVAAFIPKGFGWHRDLPDYRDFTPHHQQIQMLVGTLYCAPPPNGRVDWREYCTQAEDQGNINSSTAKACLGLVQYYECRAHSTSIELSDLFVYKAARRLLKWPGDIGAQLRVTWKAVVHFGVPPLEVWPPGDVEYDRDPDAFAFSSAIKFPMLHYVRLDNGSRTLENVKSFLAAGFPSVFGFPVYSSISDEPEIFFPTLYDKVRGGQAVMAVGYDDLRRIRSEKGALLVRNSWGPQWGDCGYGWLPYEFVRTGLATDFWTLLEPSWLESGEFSQPRLHAL
jgi:C1A family cysteine protease